MLIFFTSCLCSSVMALAAAAIAGFQFSKHLGVPDLPRLLNVCKRGEAERDKLHNNTGVKVKDKNKAERKVKIEKGSSFRHIL